MLQMLQKAYGPEVISRPTDFHVAAAFQKRREREKVVDDIQSRRSNTATTDAWLKTAHKLLQDTKLTLWELSDR